MFRYFIRIERDEYPALREVCLKAAPGELLGFGGAGGGFGELLVIFLGLQRRAFLFRNIEAGCLQPQSQFVQGHPRLRIHLRIVNGDGHLQVNGIQAVISFFHAQGVTMWEAGIIEPGSSSNPVDWGQRYSHLPICLPNIPTILILRMGFPRWALRDSLGNSRPSVQMMRHFLLSSYRITRFSGVWMMRLVLKSCRDDARETLRITGGHGIIG